MHGWHVHSYFRRKHILDLIEQQEHKYDRPTETVMALAIATAIVWAVNIAFEHYDRSSNGKFSYFISV